MKLFETNPSGVGVATTRTQIGTTKTNSASSPGDITISESGLSFAMTSGRNYFIEFTGGGTAGDFIFAYSVTISP
jgi:hypothetical protein